MSVSFFSCRQVELAGLPRAAARAASTAPDSRQRADESRLLRRDHGVLHSAVQAIATC